MRRSYSSVNCYYQCPLKYKFRYLDKVPVQRTTTPAMERGTEIHSCFEAALGDPTAELPAPFDYYTTFINTLREHGAKPEQTIVLMHDWSPAPPWEEGWVKSILDAGLVNGAVAHNYDWKTGKIYDEHQEQRELYSIMQFCAYPEVEVVIGTHVYVDKKENRSTEFKREQLPALKAKWEEKVRPLYEDDVFPANPSYSCRYCDFSKWNGGGCKF